MATCPNGCELLHVLCCTGSFRLFGLASRLLRLLFMLSSVFLLYSTYCFVTRRAAGTPRPSPGMPIVRASFPLYNYVFQALLVRPRATSLLQGGRLLSNIFTRIRAKQMERELRKLQRKPSSKEKPQRRFRAKNVPQQGQGLVVVRERIKHAIETLHL